MSAQKLLSRRAVCDLIDVSDDTLKRMITKGEFPPPTHRLGGGSTAKSDRWREDLVYAWQIIESNEFGPFFQNLVKSKATPAELRRTPQNTANEADEPGD